MAAYEITTAGAVIEFNTSNGLWNSCWQIDDTHFINFFEGTSSDGYAQVFAVNTTTWAVTTAAAAYRYEFNECICNSCWQIDSNHFINFWSGYLNKWEVSTFTVDTTAWTITEPDTLQIANAGDYHSCAQVDANHFIDFAGGSSGDGYAQVVTVDTSTWVVTTSSDALEFDAVNADHNSCCKVDTNHFINFWCGNGEDGFVQMFTVNTTTWAVTTAAASLEFDTQAGFYNNCAKIDDTHFINFWCGTDYDGFAQVFAVNTTTWEVTTAAARLEFDTQTGYYNHCRQIDSNHFINYWQDADADGKAQIFTVNTSTWGITTSAALLEFDTQTGGYFSAYKIDTSHYITFWGGVDSDGFAQVMAIEMPSSGFPQLIIC